MVRKTSSATASRKTVAKTATTNPRSRATAAPAVRSTEIKPRRTLVETARKLKSPKVLVPLAVAVGVGVAAVARLLNGHKTNGSALPRLGKNLSPHFSNAVHALADLGRELRAKVR